MTKERLKELMKQHGIVYARKDNKIIEINLETCVIDDNCLLVGYDPVFDDCEDCYDISRLYETREQAEWSLKMQAERTERFEPPMWEDIKRFYGFSFYGNVIDELYHREEYRFFVDKLTAITVVDISKKQPFRDVYSSITTKENYEKACEIVRDLFGGKNANCRND